MESNRLIQVDLLNVFFVRLLLLETIPDTEMDDDIVYKTILRELDEHGIRLEWKTERGTTKKDSVWTWATEAEAILQLDITPMDKLRILRDALSRQYDCTQLSLNGGMDWIKKQWLAIIDAGLKPLKNPTVIPHENDVPILEMVNKQKPYLIALIVISILVLIVAVVLGVTFGLPKSSFDNLVLPTRRPYLVVT